MTTTTQRTPIATQRPTNPAIVAKASILLRHAAAHHGLKDRIQRAMQLADEYPSTITKGRGYDHDRGYFAYVGGHGDEWFVPFEVARAKPHHKTAQDEYSISRQDTYHANGEIGFTEYTCTCADARRSSMTGGAPFIPGWGTCCKHVLAYLLMRAVGAIEEVTP